MEIRHHYGKNVHILHHPVLLTLLARLGHPEQALHHLELCVALGPERASSRAALGASLLQLGRTDEARAQLERGVALEPTAAFLALLADAEARSGRLEAAVVSQQRAVAAAEAAQSPDVARLHNELEVLRQRQRAEGGAASSSAAPAATEGAVRPRLIAPPARRPQGR